MYSFLQTTNFILASSSPRRKEMLEAIGIKLTISPPDFIEARQELEGALEYCQRNAIGKGQWVANNDANAQKPNSVIISADTIVVIKGEVLEKPKDKADSMRMLTLLSASRHEVYTAVAVLKMGKKQEQRHFVEKSLVQFRKLDAAEIDAYSSNKEPYDKAGGYSLQGLGGIFISQVQGSYQNIIGLPLCSLVVLLKEFLH